MLVSVAVQKLESFSVGRLLMVACLFACCIACAAVSLLIRMGKKGVPHG